jgi:hypothetical protein
LTIQGPGPRGIARPTDHRVSGSPAAQGTDASTGTDTTKASREPADVLEVRQQVSTGPVPSGTMSPEELRDVTAWIAAGGHDTPGVHEAVARAIDAEVRGPAS